MEANNPGPDLGITMADALSALLANEALALTSVALTCGRKAVHITIIPLTSYTPDGRELLGQQWMLSNEQGAAGYYDEGDEDQEYSMEQRLTVLLHDR